MFFLCSFGLVVSNFEFETSVRLNPTLKTEPVEDKDTRTRSVGKKLFEVYF